MSSLFVKQPLMTKSSQADYTRASTCEAESLKGEEDEYNFRLLETRQPRLSVLQVLFFCLSLLLSVLSLTTFLFARAMKPSDNQCARQLSVWSPALDVLEYYEVDFENGFEESSIYRGPPTHARDKAWAELWESGVIFNHATVNVPPSKLHLLNKTADSQDWRKAPDGNGYMATLDVFHQLHCLNLIRQYTWLLAGNYAPQGQGTDTRVEIPLGLRSTAVGNRMHIDHCIETLRKTIMCHGDVTPVMVINDAKAPLGARADFNVHQKCRDFKKLKKWLRKDE